MKIPYKDRSPEYKARQSAKEKARDLAKRGGLPFVSGASLAPAAIAAKSSTPKGFSNNVAEGGSRRFREVLERMVRAGELHVAKAGHRFHYFSSVELADVFRATQIKPPKMSRVSDHGKAVRVLIDKLSATPAGFRYADAGKGKNIAENICPGMVERGELHRAKVHGKTMRHFDTAERMTAFIRACCVEEKHEKALPVRGVLTDIKPLRHALLPRESKPAKVVVRKDAEAFYPERYIKTTRLWVDRYAVTVPMVRMGSAAWLAGVGGAA